ncbi:IclR family transcriptional regulator [Paracoccus liaowanqingii]|nr:helix-turn-helix domain-containing protein [Paracoccus liaowanqingii]
MPAKRTNGTERALDILDCMARLNRSASRVELVSETGMPRSTVYAVTEFLLQRGWLTEGPTGLLLGPQAGFISNAYLHQQGFEHLARQILAELSEQTGNLSELDVIDNWYHVAALSEGLFAQGYLRPVEGARLPLMPTAAARIMLADLPESLIRQNIPEEALRDAHGAYLPWERFISEMREGQLKGYVHIDGWLGGLATTLACPVVGENGQILASVCIIIQSGSAAPHLAANLPPLMEAGKKLSALLRRMSWPYAESCKRRLMSSG